MTICPFPVQQDIYPCSCLVNQDFEMFVNCDNKGLQGQDPHAFFQKINSAFECGGRIKELHINMNGSDLSNITLGKLQIGRLQIFNFDRMQGSIQEGAFTGSSSTLKEITIVLGNGYR